MIVTCAMKELNHALVTAKLDAYGFSQNSLKNLCCYLTKRWQLRKVNKIVAYSNTSLLKGLKFLFLDQSGLLFILGA